jgi:hypothetical protein
MSYWGFPEYVSVAEKKAKAAKKLKELMKKKPDLKPVLLEGKALARTWWGKAWNGNLERYADYSNRIGRGRSYVRHGAVLHLHIDEGEVKSLVQGSQRSPYSVEIKISALETDIRQAVSGHSERILSRASKKTSRVIEDADLSAVFGIEMEASDLQVRKRKKPTGDTVKKKKVHSKIDLKHRIEDVIAVPEKRSVKPDKTAKAKPASKGKPQTKPDKGKVKKAAKKNAVSGKAGK